LPGPFWSSKRPSVAAGGISGMRPDIRVSASDAWMIVPMLLKIDLAALGQVGNHWRVIVATVGANWLKPFSMALLGWLFIAHLFRPFLPADQIDGYIARLILLAANRISRCRKSRSTTRSWWWPSRRLWRCCSACPRSRCHGTR
jgi:hypothetical protein